MKVKAESPESGKALRTELVETSQGVRRAGCGHGRQGPAAPVWVSDALLLLPPHWSTHQPGTTTSGIPNLQILTYFSSESCYPKNPSPLLNALKAPDHEPTTSGVPAATSFYHTNFLFMAIGQREVRKVMWRLLSQSKQAPKGDFLNVFPTP